MFFAPIYIIIIFLLLKTPGPCFCFSLVVAKKTQMKYDVYIGTTPHPVTVTTRIIPFLVGNPYKPSFVTVTGWGVDRKYTYVYCTFKLLNRPSFR